MLADGITNSVLDPMSARVPYFCYLGFALGEFGIMPLGGRFGARWYPVKIVEHIGRSGRRIPCWRLNGLNLRIELRYGLVLKGPPKASLP